MVGQIVLMIIGVYLLLVNGILGVGMNWGRAKRYSNKFGQGPMRIIYVVIGLALIVFGVLAILNPELLSKN